MKWTSAGALACLAGSWWCLAFGAPLLSVMGWTLLTWWLCPSMRFGCVSACNLAQASTSPAPVCKSPGTWKTGEFRFRALSIGPLIKMPLICSNTWAMDGCKFCLLRKAKSSLRVVSPVCVEVAPGAKPVNPAGNLPLLVLHLDKVWRLMRPRKHSPLRNKQQKNQWHLEVF